MSSEDDEDTEADGAECESFSLSRAIQEAKEVQSILLVATDSTVGLAETEHMVSALAGELEVRIASTPIKIFS